MRGDIFRGLIEAITNADDAYGDHEGPIVIHVHRARGRVWSVSVLDHATGIPLRDMEPRLATIGGRTSGHERGANVRGNRGRGAKDLAAYGAARWDSIADGEYGQLEIERDGRYRIAREPQVATAELRERLGIAGNGTLVTILCTGNVTRPRFETMVDKLERAVPLRDIMQSATRTVKLAYLDEPPLELRYQPDRTLKHVERTTFDVPGYVIAAQLDLWEAAEPLRGGPGDSTRESGILIKSGRAVHEASAFSFEMDPYAAYFCGEVRWDAIDELVREFELRDERGREPSSANPFSLISRMRDGLEKTHPAYEALTRAVDPILAKHIARRRTEDANVAAETTQTRKRLHQLARVVTEFSLDKEEELAMQLSGGSGSDVHVPVLRVIPGSRALRVDESATFAIMLRTDAVGDDDVPVASLAIGCEPSDAVAIEPTSVVLEKVDGGAFFRGAFVARGVRAPGKAIVGIRVDGGRSCAASIDIVETQPEEKAEGKAPLAFCFEQERYAVPTGKRRFLRLAAPNEAVIFSGTLVNVRSSDSDTVQVRDEHVTLHRSQRGAWYEGRICVEGRKDGAAADVVARLGSSLQEAVTRVVVGREDNAPAIAIEIGQFEGFARARWQRDPGGDVTITINAAHPAARRYMGAPPEYVGQESVLSRFLIAEIVAEEVVRDLLSRRYRGSRIDPDAYAADRLRMLGDLLPRCHASQISAGEAEAFANPKAGRARAGDTAQEGARRRVQPELFKPRDGQGP